MISTPHFCSHPQAFEWPPSSPHKPPSSAGFRGEGVMPGLVPVSYKEPSSEPDRKIDSQNQELQAQNQENEGR